MSLKDTAWNRGVRSAMLTRCNPYFEQHRDAAFAVVESLGWPWVTPWSFAWAEAAADEATFQIARTLNRSRADSKPARMRWWRVYAAFPEIYREAAAKVWQRSIIEARKRA